MSLTGGSLIQQALLMIGVYDPGETPSTSEQNDILLVANNQIDNWSLERGNVPVIVLSSVALTSGVSAYTFGPSGTFGSTRYLGLESATILVPSAAIAGTFTRHPLKMLTEAEFLTAVSSPQAGDQLPVLIYYDNAYPLATATLFPVPTFTGTAPELEIGGWQPLPNFPDTVTTVATPKGFDEAMVLNLAVKLAPQYPGVAQLPPELAENAEKALLRFMNWNMRQPGAPPPPSVDMPQPAASAPAER